MSKKEESGNAPDPQPDPAQAPPAEPTPQAPDTSTPPLEKQPDAPVESGPAKDDASWGTGDPPAPSDAQETPPEQQTPTPEGGNVFVPDAAGEQTSGVTADPAADVTPAVGGVTNVAGTPQSGLSQASPMVDESGSNVPAPNMTQPVVAMPAAPNLTADSLDPAITDPVGTAKERVEGRTSDAANREAGVTASEVPPDINAGVKQSDAGPDLYPFPPGGDVDVATIPEGDNAGEYLPPLSVEDQVVFIEHDLIPERLVGRRAFVVDAPRYLVPLDKAGEVWITARTRDEINATLTIPLSAVKLERGGRPTTVRG